MVEKVRKEFYKIFKIFFQLNMYLKKFPQLSTLVILEATDLEIHGISTNHTNSNTVLEKLGTNNIVRKFGIENLSKNLSGEKYTGDVPVSRNCAGLMITYFLR